MKIESAKLTGRALDFAVGQAVYKDRRIEVSPYGHIQVELRPGSGEVFGFGWFVFNPSENWAQAGPIIEREQIDVLSSNRATGRHWIASVTSKWYRGPTPLIAAMRCCVAKKLGNVVDVPKEIA